MRSGSAAATALTLAILAGLGPKPRAAPPEEGIVVVGLQPGAAGERGGLREGDVLLAWTREGLFSGDFPAVSGRFRTPFDLFAVETEQSPRGPVRLLAEREGAPFVTSPEPGPWGVAAAPRLEGEALAAFRAGGKELGAGQLDAGLSRWRRLAEKERRCGAPPTAAWLLLRVGEETAKAGRPEEARCAFEEALEAARESGQERVRPWILKAGGEALAASKDYAGAVAALRAALVLLENGGEEHALEEAGALFALAGAERRAGEAREAERHLERALESQQRQAPGSLPLAATLHRLGSFSLVRGDLDGAERRYLQSLAITLCLAPRSLAAANALGNLGTVARNRGDLGLAVQYHLRALAIEQELEPGSLGEADTLQSLAIVDYDRGDFAAAEPLYRRALGIYEEKAPESLDLAGILNNLGALRRARDDLEGAARLYARAAEIKERLAPGSAQVASTLLNLGELAQARADYGEADRLFAQAQAIFAFLAPRSISEAAVLHNRAMNAEAGGELETAEVLFEKALAMKQATAPDSLTLASTLRAMGELAARRGRLARAEPPLLRALDLARRWAPGSHEEARAAHALAGLRLQQGRRAEALRSDLEAVEAIESQARRLGGSREVGERFSAQYADYYREAVDLLVRLGRGDEAFLLLERFRARSLLEMLAERDLDFRKDAPEELLQEERRTRRALEVLYGRRARLGPQADPASLEALRDQIASLEEALEGLEARLRSVSPVLASLRYPHPLSAREARRVLGPKTLLLTYCAGEKRTILLTLLDGRLAHYALPVDRARLERSCRALRGLLSTQGAPLSQVQARAAGLYHLLLGPAEGELASARDVVICADGPLHYLPFAALRTPRGHYLVEEKPLAMALSATVLGELAPPGGKDREAPSLWAFGGCVYDAAQPDGAPALSGLPATAREVARAGGEFPGRARLFTGEAATEEQAKRLGGTVTYVHFACHGLLSESAPLDSALALTSPRQGGEEDGFLRAWEILEGVRVRSDLVVLSGCQTALGEARGGEGLIGLTRAWEYAGARAVLSSLWSVSDESTCDLMARFYEGLRRGAGKARALQEAQVSLLRSRPRAGAPRGYGTEAPSHPFRWAGFVLNGDWR